MTLSDDDIKCRHKVGLILIAIGLLYIMLTVGCGTIKKQLFPHDDALLEEIVEAQIEKYVGVDIDLTPNSPE